MVLSDEDITKFQILCKSEFGIEISKEDAYEKGSKLLKLVSTVYKPMTEEEYEQLQKINQTKTMGMDVYGIKPLNEGGEYFRHNVWAWRPLWTLITYTCENILSEEDIKMGHYNSGHIISNEKALKIADTLDKTLLEKDKYPFEDEDAEWHEWFWENSVKSFIKFCRNSGGFRIF